ncbi:3-phosphoserine/phosphohydroxythreonine transaminase [Ichthyobacterium seriolicida]|uniref:Phosphoserine aminotransferase n=1 Tax=Ichthyobacterium seriolicida TaxID=242600 RepID=A0A1J1DZB9_9FLAO|nr:3-phosphoserine/phosphohydroxythreonine transaminase [Ichthyobacterium seriolicida]BAV95241.1 phosphoserine aminotransferase [Ichthyobacterium seriolicida]
MVKFHNFSAGPGILNREVLKQLSESVYNDRELSIAEISHRGSKFVDVMERARGLVKELLDVPEGYSVLFLQGGASMQFLMAPVNLLHKNKRAGYINTGVWSKKAIAEAKNVGDVTVVADSSDKNFNYIPKEYTVPNDLAYLHYTSNNTIFGTQFKRHPESDVFLVSDMSSDIFSREIDVSKHGLIYAGAQKNIGPAGVTLVIVKDELLGDTGRAIPNILNYRKHIDAGSMLNTPSVLAVYTVMLTLEWFKREGGVKVFEHTSEEKANLLYDEIDRNPLFVGNAMREDRSLMNVTFILKDKSVESKFVQLCKEANIVGINGHRLVGGYRASIYNAMTIDSVNVLVEIMRDLEKKC